MTVQILDHLYFFAIALALPVYGYFWLQKRLALVLAGRSELRMTMYRSTFRQEWVLVLVLAALWFGAGRSAAELGLGLSGGLPAWSGYGLMALICGLLVMQMRTAISSPEARAKLLKPLGEIVKIMPHTIPERRMFVRVAVTAGICEEIIYRGFGIAYLTALFGIPFWAAALLSSAVFGFAHAYQGPVGALRTAAVGLAMAILYGLTGALWAPMVAHIVIDVTAAYITYAALSGTGPEVAPEPVA